MDNIFLCFHIEEEKVRRAMFMGAFCVAGIVPDSRPPSPCTGDCTERNPYMDHQGGEDQGHLPHAQHVQLWRVTQLPHRRMLVSSECAGGRTHRSQEWRGWYFLTFQCPIRNFSVNQFGLIFFFFFSGKSQLACRSATHSTNSFLCW